MMAARARLIAPLMLWTAMLGCGAALAKPAALTLESINGARFAPLPDPAAKTPTGEIVRAEVLLDRARVSPGAIDGIDGDNFRKAVGAYQAIMGLPVTSRLDQATWDKLTEGDKGPVAVERKLTAKDVKGPFAQRIPAKFEAQADLKHMAYTSVLEEISEQSHASQGLLKALNPRANWKRADQTVILPQVVADRPKAEVARIVVDKPGHAVAAFAADGKLIAFYPASIGSEEKPAPSGDFVVEHVTHNPDYTYNPKYAFKGVKATQPFTIAAGPNNPVGSVWMALSDEGYGIHGTPQPDLVGKTQSHGCIRLTNWDAEDLASMVGKKTPVHFADEAVALVPPPPPAPAPAPAVPTPVAAPSAPPSPPPVAGTPPAAPVPASPEPKTTPTTPGSAPAPQGG